jgi:hypothetical protein
VNRIENMNDALRFAGASQLESHTDLTDEIFDFILHIGRVQKKRAAAEQGALAPLNIFEMIV